MRPRAALDLREIGLADRLAELLTDRAHDFELRHLTIESAQGALHLSQVLQLFAERHSLSPAGCCASPPAGRRLSLPLLLCILQIAIIIWQIAISVKRNR